MSVQFQHEPVADPSAPMHLHHYVIAVSSLCCQKARGTGSVKGCLVYARIARKFDKVVNIVRKATDKVGGPGQANQSNFGLWKLAPDGPKGRNRS